jgi:hypothetical protein
MLIEELNKKRIPESHNKIKKSGATFGYNLPGKKEKLFVLFV